MLNNICDVAKFTGYFMIILQWTPTHPNLLGPGCTQLIEKLKLIHLYAELTLSTKHSS